MKRKFIKDVIKFVVFLIAFYGFSFFFISAAIRDLEYDSVYEYVVAPGDTLWGIAKEIRGDLKLDIRTIVDEIRLINNISPEIFPGQKINLPKL